MVARCTQRKVGSRFTNQYGDSAVILRDVSAKLVEVSYDSGTLAFVMYSHLKRGVFKDFMKPSVYGVGFLGSPVEKTGEGDRQIYNRWHSIIRRCYSGAFNAYLDVTVCDDWLNFSNFRAWMLKQRHADDKNWQLDKDLFSSRVYCPEACVLLPREINVALISKAPVRSSSGLPMGVSKARKGYAAKICVPGRKTQKLGVYSNIEDAKEAYKNAREARVQTLAGTWQHALDKYTYDKLIDWEFGEMK